MTQPGHTLHNILVCAGLNHRQWDNLCPSDRERLAKAEEGMRVAFVREMRARGVIDDSSLNYFVSAETWRREMSDEPFTAR